MAYLRREDAALSSLRPCTLLTQAVYISVGLLILRTSCARPAALLYSFTANIASQP